MYAELGIQPSALAIACHYGPLLTHFILDKVDEMHAAEVENMGIQTLVTNTLMRTPADRRRLAKDVLNFIQTL
jgi:2-phospho-L-lactate transferase/gluconeogenesis factor (CofD/UPF0052 family)